MLLQPFRIIIIFSIICLTCGEVLCQKFKLTEGEARTISQKIEIDLPLNPSSPNVSRTASTDDFLKSLVLELKEGDLWVNFELAEPENLIYYHIWPSFKLNGVEIPVVLAKEVLGDWGKEVLPGSRSFTWTNIYEKYGILQGDLLLELEISAVIREKTLYDCSKGMPVFGNKQKLPYYSAAFLGGLSLGLGGILDNSSKNLYQDYLSSSTLSEASPLYTSANNQNKASKVLLVSGASILVADLILFLIRNRKHKNNLQKFELECGAASIGNWGDNEVGKIYIPRTTSGLSIGMKFSF